MPALRKTCAAADLNAYPPEVEGKTWNGAARCNAVLHDSVVRLCRDRTRLVIDACHVTRPIQHDRGIVDFVALPRIDGANHVTMSLARLLRKCCYGRTVDRFGAGRQRLRHTRRCEGFRQ